MTATSTIPLKRRLRRPPLRVQLTVLYAGLFVVLVAAVLAISGLLVRQGSTSINGGSSSRNALFGHQINAAPVIVAVAATVAALGLAWWIAGRFLRPLRSMNVTAREISATNLHRRLGLDGPQDELIELGHTLDDLFARLEAAFEAQRHFVANASHELRTPLAGLQTLLEVTIGDPDADSETLRAACQEALTLSQYQQRLIQALLTLATSERGIEHWEPFDLATITDTVLAGRTHTRSAETCTSIQHSCPPKQPATPNSSKSLTNLIENAIRHNATWTDRGLHHLGPRTSNHHRQQHRATIAPNEIDRLFQPFQRAGRQRSDNLTATASASPSSRPSPSPPRQNHRTAPTTRRPRRCRHLRRLGQVTPDRPGGTWLFQDDSINQPAQRTP